MSISRISVVVCVAVVLAVSVGAQATVDATWGNDTGGDFRADANWDTTAPIGATDTATFNRGTANYTVTFSANTTNTQCDIKTDIVSFDLSDGGGGGRTYTITGNPGFSVGAGETGVLTIGNTGGTGGKVATTGGVCYIGNGTGNGTVTVQNGAELEVAPYANYLYVANDVGSTGKVVVTGAGSVVDAHYCRIGKGGDSTLEIKDGGLFDVADLFYTGQDAGSTATVLVDGDGSTLYVKKYHYVGYGGTSVVDIQNGGLAKGDGNGAYWVLGNLSGSNATVNVGVTGTGTWNTGTTTPAYVTVGGRDATRVGVVNVGPGGTVTTGDVTVQEGGTINLALGDWIITSDLDVNDDDDDTTGLVKFEFTDSDYGTITVAGNVDISNVYIEFTGSGLTGVETGQCDFITAEGAFNDSGMTSNIDTVMQGMGFAPGNYSLDVVSGSETLRLTYVPEPATMGLLCIGGVLVLLRKRRK